MFEAQTWEPELRKSLDLGPSVPLRRVSEVYEVPEFPYHRVRVDRVYRTDRQARVVGVTGKDEEAAPITERSHVPLSTALPGELVWETAMVADHVMVQTEARVTRERLHRSLPAKTRIRDQITQSGLYLVEVPAEGERSLERAILALGRLKEVVKFAEPDFLMSGADTTPNDPLYAGAPGPQWHLPKIMAPRAWDVIKEPKTPADAETTVVAVVDTGVDYTHPDLSPNMWTNPNEIAANGQDDDGNGKIDDVSGWDFIGQSTVKTTIIEDNNPMDDSGHGTHVAGIIGAVGNNALGVSGVCWGVKILPLRIIKKVGTGTYGTYSTALGALDYIKTLNRNGRVVAVANHSWGGSGYSLAMLNSINNPVAAPDPLPAGITSTFLKDVNQLTVAGSGTEQAKIKIGMTITGTGIPAGTLVTIVSGSTVTLSNYTTVARTNQAVTFSKPVRPKPYGVVHVAAAGNSRANNDRIPTYPASFSSGFIISVGATDLNDNVATWSGTAGSNYGRLTVDLFAPGSGIWSTKLKMAADSGYGYESRNGTSMAAPQVSGTVAVLRMWQPDLTDYQTRQVVIDQVDVLTSLSQKCLSGGRLNVAKVVDKLYQPILVHSGGSTGGSGITTNALQAAMGVTGRLAGGVSGDFMLIVDQGEVWAWGWNKMGQLGNGTTATSAVPVKVSGLSQVEMVTIASNTGFALKADGTVWAWGSNTAGMLGVGSTYPSFVTVPQQVPGLTDITWISAGSGHCLAVRADGEVFGWGDNGYGQLGDGTQMVRWSPIQIPNLHDIIQASASSLHSVARTTSGQVYAWGDRGRTTGSNKLGDGDLTSIATSPVMVTGIADVAYVSATGNSSLYLLDDGSVWYAGNIPGSPFTLTPKPISGLSNISILSGGNNHAIAVDAEGKLYAFGLGNSGQLGIGQLVYSLNPTESVLPPGTSVLACGARGNQSVILTTDGRLFTCGSNHNSGRLGHGISPDRVFPVQMESLRGVSAFGASGLVRWARDPDGVTRMWGHVNDMRLLSAETWFQRPTIYPNPGLPSAMVEVASPANGVVIARLDNGTVWSWGYNTEGCLGRTGNTTTPSFIPGLNQTVSVSSGNFFSLAASSGGNVYSWGKNNYGQLGDGSTTTQTSPVYVNGLDSVIKVSAGSTHGMALKGNGTVWTWGRNDLGQLGDGTLTDRLTPAQVPGLASIVQIEAAMNWSGSPYPGASYALRADGTLFGWGQSGLYFSNATGNFRSPTVIYASAQKPIVKFACVQSAIVALLNDNTLVSWGDETMWPLGRAPGFPGDTASMKTPAPVFGGTDVRDVVAGRTGGSVLFQKNDGTLWCWGRDDDTIGLGESYATTFVGVVGFGGSATTVSSLGTESFADSWILLNFSNSEILDPAISGDNANPAQDGIQNLIKYALGLSPNQRYDSSSLPSMRVDVIGASAQSESAGREVQLFSTPTVDLTSGKRYLAYTVNRSAGIRQDIDYIVEVSNDLVTWNSGDPYTVTVLDTAEVLEVYSATSLDDAPLQFMRLRIQRK
jgi:alpha-tubulin suppressor-like RCC1 family protein/subtilisin family serine protease